MEMRTKGMDIDMDDAEGWLAAMLASGRKTTTVTEYRGALRQCFATLMVNGQPYDPESIGPDAVRLLWSELAVKEGVRRSYIRILAEYVEYRTGRDPAKSAGLLYNREVRDRVFIDKAGFAILWREGDAVQRVIMALGAFMGLRRGEMHAIRDGDIVDGTLVVHGKGHGRDGLMMTVRIPDIVLDAICVYVEWRDAQGPRVDDYLIQSPRRDGKLHHIPMGTMSDRITELSRRTGVRATIHSFRRFFATTLYYDTGSDIQTIKTLMRHADISTTFRCYIDAYDARSREATDRLAAVVGDLIGAD